VGDEIAMGDPGAALEDRDAALSQPLVELGGIGDLALGQDALELGVLLARRAEIGADEERRRSA
jgi:hypothetical protein